MRALTWVAGIGLVVAAWFVQTAAPGSQAVSEAFPVTGSVGEEVAGRDIVVTVEGVRRAAEVNGGGWSGEGNWLVVDIDAASRLTSRGTLLGLAEFVTEEGVTYRASERADDSLYRGPLTAGIPRSGSLLFELPAGFDGDGTLRLGVDMDERFDSVVEVPLAVSGLPIAPRIEIAPVGWSAP